MTRNQKIKKKISVTCLKVMGCHFGTFPRFLLARKNDNYFFRIPSSGQYSPDTFFGHFFRLVVERQDHKMKNVIVLNQIDPSSPVNPYIVAQSSPALTKINRKIRCF